MISKTIGFRGTQHFQTHPYQFEIPYKLRGHQLLNVDFPAFATWLITGYQMLLTQTQLVYKSHASQISNSKSVQITWFLKS
jgi:hypothetical protein